MTTVSELTVERNQLREEVEQLRVQLAGCGVAAMQNTAETIKDRCKDGDYGYSASYGDVCKAVDREMRYRETLERICSMQSPYAADAKDYAEKALHLEPEMEEVETVEAVRYECSTCGQIARD